MTRPTPMTSALPCRARFVFALTILLFLPLQYEEIRMQDRLESPSSNIGNPIEYLRPTIISLNPLSNQKDWAGQHLADIAPLPSSIAIAGRLDSGALKNATGDPGFMSYWNGTSITSATGVSGEVSNIVPLVSGGLVMTGPLDGTHLFDAISLTGSTDHWIGLQSDDGTWKWATSLSFLESPPPSLHIAVADSSTILVATTIHNTTSHLGTSVRPAGLQNGPHEAGEVAIFAFSSNDGTLLWTQVGGSDLEDQVIDLAVDQISQQAHVLIEHSITPLGVDTTSRSRPNAIFGGFSLTNNAPRNTLVGTLRISDGAWIGINEVPNATTIEANPSGGLLIGGNSPINGCPTSQTPQGIPIAVVSSWAAINSCSWQNGITGDHSVRIEGLSLRPEGRIAVAMSVGCLDSNNCPTPVINAKISLATTDLTLGGATLSESLLAIMEPNGEWTTQSLLKGSGIDQIIDIESGNDGSIHLLVESENGLSVGPASVSLGRSIMTFTTLLEPTSLQIISPWPGSSWQASSTVLSVYSENVSSDILWKSNRDGWTSTTSILADMTSSLVETLPYGEQTLCVSLDPSSPAVALIGDDLENCIHVNHRPPSLEAEIISLDITPSSSGGIVRILVSVSNQTAIHHENSTTRIISFSNQTIAEFTITYTSHGNKLACPYVEGIAGQAWIKCREFNISSPLSDDDNDGVLNLADSCPETNQTDPVDDAGCSESQGGIPIYDAAPIIVNATWAQKSDDCLILTDQYGNNWSIVGGGIVTAASIRISPIVNGEVICNESPARLLEVLTTTESIVSPDSLIDGTTATSVSTSSPATDSRAPPIAIFLIILLIVIAITAFVAAPFVSRRHED